MEAKTNITLKDARRMARQHNAGENVIQKAAMHTLNAADVLALTTDFSPMRRVGTTDERTVCELCGKTGLKKTVAFKRLDDGEYVYYGSDCAQSFEFFTR